MKNKAHNNLAPVGLFVLLLQGVKSIKCLIYTRVMPNNQRVHRSDRLQAQEKRCRDFADELHVDVTRVYADQGEMQPPCFLPGINSLLERLKNRNEESLVIADHPGRLGVKDAIRKMLMQRIEEAGATFISVYHTPSACLEKIGDMIRTEENYKTEKEF